MPEPAAPEAEEEEDDEAAAALVVDDAAAAAAAAVVDAADLLLLPPLVAAPAAEEDVVAALAGASVAEGTLDEPPAAVELAAGVVRARAALILRWCCAQGGWVCLVRGDPFGYNASSL